MNKQESDENQNHCASNDKSDQHEFNHDKAQNEEFDEDEDSKSSENEVDKTKKISKQKKRGRRRKYNDDEKPKGYIRKFPKDMFKQQMIKMESTCIRELAKIQFQKQQKQKQQNNEGLNDDVKNHPKAYEFNDTLEWEIVSKETGYKQQNCLFHKIFSYINEEMDNPSDPLNQEFVSLSLENYIVTFCSKNMITREQYLNADKIVQELPHKPQLRFYELQFDELCQIVVADISLTLYEQQTLQQISIYIKLLINLFQAIQQQNIITPKLTTIEVNGNQKLDFILPFQIDQDIFMQSNSGVEYKQELIEIIIFFNYYWQSLFQHRFKYYGIYIQFKQQNLNKNNN